MPLSLASLLPAVAALAAVLALVLLAGRAARFTGLARPNPRSGLRTAHRLALQDSLQLDRAHRLHIVRCDGRDVLLLTGGATDQIVGWLPNLEAAP